MNIPEYYKDIAHTNTAPLVYTDQEELDTLSGSTTSLFLRIERYIAALYIATDHIEDHVSLKEISRTLAGELFLAFREGTLSKKQSTFTQLLTHIQSTARILVVAGYISEQNATVLIQAADILKKEGMHFFQKDISLKKTPAEIHAFLDTSNEISDGELKTKGEKKVFPNTDTESKDRESNSSIKLAQPVFIKEKQSTPPLPSDVSATHVKDAPLVVRSTEKSKYALQEHVPTGFSQNISLSSQSAKEVLKNSISKKEIKSIKSPLKNEVLQRSVLSKKEESRRERISSVLAEKKDTTIKDIVSSFPDISEKTLQRELNDMVESGLLRRLGERRWSRYELVRFGS